MNGALRQHREETLPAARYARSGGARTLGCAAALAAVLLAACSASPPDDGGGPASGSAASGKELFAANCAVCHGADGEGQPNWHVRKPDGVLPAPPLNGDGHTWHHGDGLLYRIVSGGGAVFEDPANPGFKSGMPAFGDRLSRDDIVAVLTYVKSLWGDKTSRGLSITESQSLASRDDPFPPSGE